MRAVRSVMGDVATSRRGPTVIHVLLGIVTAAALVGSGAATAASADPIPSGGVHAATADASGANWPAFLFGPSHTSYNAGATSITPSDISSLNPVWRWNLPRSTDAGDTALDSSPTVVDGVVYIGSRDGNFYAFSEKTHKPLWSDFMGTACATQGFTSTAAVTTNSSDVLTAYVDAPDGYLYAIDAATGAVEWKGLVDDPDPVSGECDYYAWGSPLVANGNVYIGISSDARTLIPGGVIAFDQSSGAVVATWHDLPSGDDGASVWSSPALAADGSIVVGTANGPENSDEPLYDESIVRLDPQTLAVEDFWQVPPSEQIPDGDFGGSPTMFTADIDGVTTPMVGECNKNGVYYALRQQDLSAGPVWQSRVTVPYPGSSQECDAAAIWNGKDLIEGGGAPSSASEPAFSGSVVALDPATGATLWSTHLNGTVVGSPTEDGAGVVAAQTWQTADGNPGVYLLNAADGSIIDFISLPESMLFGQPVFVGSDLLIGAGPEFGLTDYEITGEGPPLTAATPSTIPTGATTSVTLTGSGFVGKPSVFISGTMVSSRSVTVVSPTELTFSAVVADGATTGPRSVSVVENGKPPTDDTCTDCLVIAAAAPRPTSADPGTIAQGSRGAAVTLSGSDFEAGAEVTSHQGIHIKTTYVSPTSLHLTVRVAPTEAAGSYNLTVTNPGGAVGTCRHCLTVTTAP